MTNFIFFPKKKKKKKKKKKNNNNNNKIGFRPLNKFSSILEVENEQSKNIDATKFSSFPASL
jgi:hypothetical protein